MVLMQVGTAGEKKKTALENLAETVREKRCNFIIYPVCSHWQKTFNLWWGTYQLIASSKLCK